MPSSNIKKVIGETVKGKPKKHLYLLLQNESDAHIKMGRRKTQIEISKMV
jgi:hypothetical protein